jgi:histidinol-phosphatase (PHP family)
MTDNRPVKPADDHVHSEWSWDAHAGNMDRTCARAVDLGLPAVAFTEHADWIRGNEAVFDAAGYFECLELCRASYPELRILSGVEMGEPHRYPEEARALVAIGFDRVLASVHCIEWRGRTADAAEPGFLVPSAVADMFSLYLREVRSLIDSDIRFDALAHLDYPKRYWPEDPAYDEALFEGEFRELLRAAASRGVAVEINTTRGRDPVRYLCPGPAVLSWWREEGGRAVCFGSDAHTPEHVGAGFGRAQDVAALAGFKPGADPLASWTR